MRHPQDKRLCALKTTGYDAGLGTCCRSRRAPGQARWTACGSWWALETTGYESPKTTGYDCRLDSGLVTCCRSRRAPGQARWTACGSWWALETPGYESPKTTGYESRLDSGLVTCCRSRRAPWGSWCGSWLACRPAGRARARRPARAICGLG